MQIEERIETLKTAIENETPVQFAYRKNPNDEPIVRTLSPYELSGLSELSELEVHHVAVLGWDHDREGIRRFAVKNMASPVTLYTRDEYIRPATGG